MHICKVGWIWSSTRVSPFTHFCLSSHRLGEMGWIPLGAVAELWWSCWCSERFKAFHTCRLTSLSSMSDRVIQGQPPPWPVAAFVEWRPSGSPGCTCHIAAWQSEQQWQLGGRLATCCPLRPPCPTGLSLFRFLHDPSLPFLASPAARMLSCF